MKDTLERIKPALFIGAGFVMLRIAKAIIHNYVIFYDFFIIIM